MTLAEMLPELNSGQLAWLENYIKQQVSDQVAIKLWQSKGGSYERTPTKTSTDRNS